MRSSGFYWKPLTRALLVVNPLQLPRLPRYGLLAILRHLQEMDEAVPDEVASRCWTRNLLQSARHIPDQAQLNRSAVPEG